jgi:hypothetical protein
MRYGYRASRQSPSGSRKVRKKDYRELLCVFQDQTPRKKR